MVETRNFQQKLEKEVQVNRPPPAEPFPPLQAYNARAKNLRVTIESINYDKPVMNSSNVGTGLRSYRLLQDSSAARS
jgi:hypothetical protein